MHFPMRICTFECFSFDKYVLFLWVPLEPIWFELIFDFFCVFKPPTYRFKVLERSLKKPSFKLNAIAIASRLVLVQVACLRRPWWRSLAKLAIVYADFSLPLLSSSTHCFSSTSGGPRKLILSMPPRARDSNVQGPFTYHFLIFQDEISKPKYLLCLRRGQKKALVLSDFSVFQLFKMVSNHWRFILQFFKSANAISLQGPATGPQYVLARALMQPYIDPPRSSKKQNKFCGPLIVFFQIFRAAWTNSFSWYI